MSEVWTIKRLIGWATEYLKKAGSDTARLDAQLLLGHITGLDQTQLYVQFDRPLGTGELQTFKTLVKRRAAAEPVAYIIGYKEFYGRRFAVDSNVLVPRPETEHLIDAVLAHLKQHETEAPRVVDVGTGSGAIAVTLACELPEAVVLGIDICGPALEMAARNAESLGVRERVKLTRGDLLAPIKSEQSVDVVASNPPYLDDALMASLAPTVRDYEPASALYGGPDGLDLHRRLTDEAARVLRPGGLLAVELSGSDQAAQLTAIWEQSGNYEDINTVNDYAQMDRILRAVRR